MAVARAVQYHLRRRVDLPDGAKVVRELGIGTSATHMEWFFGPKGLKFSEIGCRPPGVRVWDIYSAINEFDLYREWARTVCWRSFDARPHRRYHVAALFKRAEGQGRIRRVEGVDEIRSRLGDSLVVSDILPIGSPRRDWKQTLLSDGFMILRHPEYRECMARMNFAINHLRIWAG